jgi:hypothetical protein
MKPYPLVNDLLEPVLRVATPCKGRRQHLFPSHVCGGHDRRREHNARLSVQRAVGSPAFVARYVPRRRGRPRIRTMSSQNQGVRP